jgi:zinc protease
MKQTVSLVVASALMIAGPARLAAQTADEIIEKHISAIGGRAALSKLTSRTMTGAIAVSSPAGELTGTIEAYAQAPNKSRQLIKVDLSAFGAGQLVVDQRFDGTTGYVLDSMNGNRDITGNQLDNMRNATFPTALLTYKEAGTKAELLGREKVGSKDVFVVQLTPKSGSASKQYLDADTLMLLKTVSTISVPQLGADVEQTVEFSDYRDVDGVKVPFSLKATNPAQSYSVTVTSIEHNKPIDEKLFVKPGI